MKKFIDKTTTPPGGFRYVQPESGFEFRSITAASIFRSIRDHRAANGYDLTPGWEDRVEDEMCASMPAGVCAHKEETPAAVGRSITVSDVVNFLKTLAYWTRDSREFVPQEEAERRAKICVDCPFNVKPANCTPCAGLAKRIASLLGARTTSHDAGLQSCAVCGCSSAQVHFPLEVLHKFLPEEINLKLPTWCWKRRI